MLDFLYNNQKVDFWVSRGTVRGISEVTDEDGYLQTVVQIESGSAERHEIFITDLEMDLRRGHGVTVTIAATQGVDFLVYVSLRNDCLSQSVSLIDGATLYATLFGARRNYKILLFSLAYSAVATWIAAEGGLISGIALYVSLLLVGKRRRNRYIANLDLHMQKVEKQIDTRRWVSKALARQL